MTAAVEFRLPNTPPQGNTFPPVVPQQRDQEFSVDIELTSVKGVERQVATSSEQIAPSPRQQRGFPPPPQPVLGLDTTSGGRRGGIRAATADDVLSTQTPASAFPLLRNKSGATGAEADTQTGVHRSMFPQYIPTAAVAPQPYNPDMPRVASPVSTQGDFQSTYSASLYSSARSPPLRAGSLSDAFAASREPSNYPLPSYRESMHDMPAVIQSTPQDVLDLWCLANGQEDQALALCYNLGLDCTDLTTNNELICLTSTAGAIYTLRATMNSLNVTRAHPLNGANTISISAPTLYTPSKSSSLVSTIFPILSKMRAIDQAASAAIAHGISRIEGLSLEREAITRAHANTAAPLLWNEQTASYCLSLPVYSADAAHSNNAPSHRTLPVEVNPNVSIRILEPSSTHTAQNPILTLSLPTKTLIVHAQSLASLPSPYAADILLSSMLVLLLHLHRQNGFLSADNAAASSSATTSVPVFAPPPRVGPTTSSLRSSRRGSRASSRSRTRSESRTRGASRLESFLHPLAGSSGGGGGNNNNPPAEGAAPKFGRSNLSLHVRSASRVSTQSHQSSATTTVHGSPPPPPGTTVLTAPSSTPKQLEAGMGRAALSERGTAPELSGKQTGLDLSRFQAYDLTDPRLGAATKLVLRLLYWSFGVLVWVVGVAVGVLAEMVVVVGSCGGRGGGK